MQLHATDYKSIRDLMKLGDVIAFGAKGFVPNVIKWATRSAVSHVGVILQSQLIFDGTTQSGKFNQIIESTWLDGFAGVTINRLSDRMKKCDGDLLWWLPLSDAARKKLDLQKFYDFMLHQNRKPYDAPQAIFSAADEWDNHPILGHLTHNTEDFSKFFCSELVAAGLEASGVIKSVNASEVTPIDLCTFNLYADDYYQFSGGEKKICGYNSVDPEGWGE